jgi:hypothetical protein
VPTAEYKASLKAREEEAAEDVQVLLGALAHKRGLTADEVQSALEAKVSAKVRAVERARAAWESRSQ